MSKKIIRSRYFAECEFQRCSPSCSLQDMTQEAMDAFDAVRERAGIPLVINCAFRSREWDKARGRSGNSAHTKGVALDIRANSSATRMKIVSAALAEGITRIGIGQGFVHLDIDDTLAQGVMWHYYE